jgi:hypothetical protein
MRDLTAQDRPVIIPAGQPGPRGEAAITEQPPLAYWAALKAVAACAARTGRLLWRRRIHLPAGHVGMRLRFAGFPGLVSKLWLADDEQGRYRGLYEWDGPRRAVSYARALWRVLALVSAPGSIHYIVLPGLRRDELLARPQVVASAAEDSPAWWRPAEVT